VIKGSTISEAGCESVPVRLHRGTDNHNACPRTSPRTTTSAATAPPTARCRRGARARSTAGSRRRNRIPAPSLASGRREHARRDLGCNERARVLRDVRPRIKPRIFCARASQGRPTRDPWSSRLQERRADGRRMSQVPRRRPAPYTPAKTRRRQSRSDPDRQGLVDPRRARDKVFDVAWSGQRKKGTNGKLPSSATRGPEEGHVHQ